MAEHLNKPGKNKGFYVRMRFSHTRNKSSSSCYRYVRLVLWFSTSLYFLTSYLISNNNNSSHNPNSLAKTTVSLSNSAIASRALSESEHKPAFLSQQGTLKRFKIYVYDLPSKYNENWLSNARCSKHLFASEVAIHKSLLNSDVRTLNPHEADFFFVPIYVSCNFSNVNGFPAIGHARSLFSSAVQLISNEFPFWNRSRGSDHVFVASHDFGACFHTMENVAIADGIPNFLKNSILLQTFGVTYKHPCQEADHVVIPPYISPESLKTTLNKFPANGKRDIFAFFRGKMEVHPKNISGRFYSRRVRTAILKKYGGDRRFYLKRHRFAGYQSEIARSVFCLCPLGWAPWSPRLVESVALGCVPVIIADGISLPFPGAVKWPEISLTVAERDIDKLGSILDHVASTNLTVIQRNLGNPAISRALLYNDDRVREGDVTWQVVESLFEKLNRRSSQWRVDT
ncbi:probable glucuronoxylan glucuronosyltransferase IRX7 [Impatiens glandulifera]|uniref:probable glucuronoxylan glucuronosyltransferase IRX7 n=1 Tax=Impatiens glandulifera TaxID=253017 RepID=UPI001FB12445|nr:probable glucuronoxylan glucuronosyltransferase IRX7 [Impatiens glandulifera]